MFACLGSERLSALIRPYLPVRQHNKRILKEDIPLRRGGARLRSARRHCRCFLPPLLPHAHFSFAQIVGRSSIRPLPLLAFAPELPRVGAAVEVLVIPKLHRHQTPTKGCLHDLTLDKCLGWLFIQLYQFSNRSPSLFLSPSIPRFSRALSLSLALALSPSTRADLNDSEECIEPLVRDQSSSSGRRTDCLSRGPLERSCLEVFCEPKRLQRSGGGREAEVKSERETKKKKVCVRTGVRACLVCVRVCAMEARQQTGGCTRR